MMKELKDMDPKSPNHAVEVRDMIIAKLERQLVQWRLAFGIAVFVVITFYFENQ